MSRIDELREEIRTLGRPEAKFTSVREVLQGPLERKRWDEANPEKATRFWELADELAILMREQEAHAAEQIRVEKLLRRQGQRMTDAGIGDKTAEALANLDEDESIQVARRWWESSKRSLVLIGGVGAGKTVAAAWLVRESIRSGGTGAMTRPTRLAAISGFEEGARELERLGRVDLLAIDDLGTENLTEHAFARLNEILDARYEGQTRTVLTSNAKWETLRQRLGERIVDRLAESGQVTGLAGKSKRRKS